MGNNKILLALILLLSMTMTNDNFNTLTRDLSALFLILLSSVLLYRNIFKNK